jgi:hypothetical protein
MSIGITKPRASARSYIDRAAVAAVIQHLDTWKRLHKALQESLESLDCLRTEFAVNAPSGIPPAIALVGSQGQQERLLASFETLWAQVTKDLREAAKSVNSLVHDHPTLAERGEELDTLRRSVSAQLLQAGRPDLSLFRSELTSLWSSIMYLLGISDRRILRLTDQAKAALEAPADELDQLEPRNV